MDTPFFDRCLLEMSFVPLDNCSLQFNRICDFTPEVAGSIDLFEIGESGLHFHIRSNGICGWDFEVVMGVKLRWVGRSEGSLGSECRVGFEDTFVIAIDLLGSV